MKHPPVHVLVKVQNPVGSKCTLLFTLPTVALNSVEGVCLDSGITLEVSAATNAIWVLSAFSLGSNMCSREVSLGAPGGSVG